MVFLEDHWLVEAWLGGDMVSILRNTEVKKLSASGGFRQKKSAWSSLGGSTTSEGNEDFGIVAKQIETGGIRALCQNVLFKTLFPSSFRSRVSTGQNQDTICRDEKVYSRCNQLLSRLIIFFFCA